MAELPCEGTRFLSVSIAQLTEGANEGNAEMSQTVESTHSHS